MSSPNPAALADQLRAWGDAAYALAGQVAAWGATQQPTPPPVPDPQPTPAPSPEPDEPGPPQPPAKPTGLTCTMQGASPVLSWTSSLDASRWIIRDELNLQKPEQVTVTEPYSVRSPLKPGQRRRYTVVAVGPDGQRSPASDPVDVPATSTPPPSGPLPSGPPTPSTGTGSTRFPADVTGPNWYLTLPTGQQGSPDTVKQPKLASYSSKYFDLTPAGDGAVFRCWHGGVTTKGSPNPRSELRECNADGSLATWSCAQGKHSITVEGQVNRLTAITKTVVLAQVHGANDDVTVFRLEGDKLWATDGNNDHGHLVDDAFTLGKRYSLGIDVVNGTISYRYNGDTVPFTLKSADAGSYFKAGNYLQSNSKSAPGESTDEYAETVIYRVAVTHTA